MFVFHADQKEVNIRLSDVSQNYNWGSFAELLVGCWMKLQGREVFAIIGWSCFCSCDCGYME